MSNCLLFFFILTQNSLTLESPKPFEIKAFKLKKSQTEAEKQTLSIEISSSIYKFEWVCFARCLRSIFCLIVMHCFVNTWNDNNNRASNEQQRKIETFLFSFSGKEQRKRAKKKSAQLKKKYTHIERIRDSWMSTIIPHTNGGWNKLQRVFACISHVRINLSNIYHISYIQFDFGHVIRSADTEQKHLFTKKLKSVVIV